MTYNFVTAYYEVLVYGCVYSVHVTQYEFKRSQLMKQLPKLNILRTPRGKWKVSDWLAKLTLQNKATLQDLFEQARIPRDGHD